MTKLKIGKVAEAAGVSVDTVRFYERRGVLGKAERLPSGYRVYGQATVTRIQLARRLQDLGLSLEEIVDALHAIDDGSSSTCASQRWRLEAVGERIEARIAELRALRREVDRVLAACDSGACVFADLDIVEGGAT